MILTVKPATQNQTITLTLLVTLFQTLTVSLTIYMMLHYGNYKCITTPLAITLVGLLNFTLAKIGNAHVRCHVTCTLYGHFRTRTLNPELGEKGRSISYIYCL